MEVLQDFPLIGGATFVSAAIILFWRMFAFVVKDRDYWRDKAMKLLDAADADLDVQERVSRPLRKVASVAKEEVDAETIASIVKAVLKT